MRSLEITAGLKIKILNMFAAMMFLLSACGPGGIIKSDITETPTLLPPANTSTLTPTPTVTATPTETPTPTITPTPLGGSANLVYAYFSMDSDDPETANAFLNIVRSGDSFSIPIETTFTPFYGSPETLLAPSLAISPDASQVMAVVNGEDSAALIEVNLRDPNPTAQFVTALPEHDQVSKMGFSPDGLWVYVNYLVGRRRYVGFLKVGTEKFIINYDCKSILDFITDESAVCSSGRHSNDIDKLSLRELTLDNSYLDIPGGKFYSATHFNWHFKAVVPPMNSFVLEREDGSFFLVPNLDTFSSLSYWYSEDIDNAVNSPVIAELPPGAYVFQFLSSPDKERIAVTGINSRGLGFGASGIDRRTFTFVTGLGETYQHKNPGVSPGTPFYPLQWSPDSRVLVGLSLGGNLSIWDPVTGETEVLHSNSAQPKIYYLNTNVHGIAVEWLE